MPPNLNIRLHGVLHQRKTDSMETQSPLPAVAGSGPWQVLVSIPMTPYMPFLFASFRPLIMLSSHLGGRRLWAPTRRARASLDSVAVKKFRSTPVLRGTKFAIGYQDRTRVSTEEDYTASRAKALEEMVNLGQMDIATFDSLRDNILGEALRDAHLVKGLDRKILERAREGGVIAVELLEPASCLK